MIAGALKKAGMIDGAVKKGASIIAWAIKKGPA
jgi:hypothetical protein